MTCRRSRDEWHSYVKSSLSELEMQEMTIHLTGCSECREIVLDIRETLGFLAKNLVAPAPPIDMKISIMAAITPNKYRRKYPRYPVELKTWGLSMVAAGLILFVVNLSPLAANFNSTSSFGFTSQIGWILTQPFNSMGRAADAVLGKVENLYGIPTKIEQAIIKEDAR